MSGLQVEFSTQRVASTLNGLFTTTSVKGIVEGKHFSALGMVFLFIGVFLSCAAGYEGQPVSKEINTIFSDTVNEILYCKPDMNMLHWKSFSLEEKPVPFKKKAKHLFENLRNVNLFTIKFHLLGHIFEGLNRCGNLEYLSASLYEHFNYVIKKFIRMTSLRRKSSLSEAVEAENKAFTTDYCIIDEATGRWVSKLAGDGVSTTLSCIYNSKIQELVHLD